MIANLLEQQRLMTRIDGEHLAGGIGDLPAAGLVRVMVNEDDFDRAREIIREWEAASPPPAEYAAPKRSNAPFWFLLGLMTGAALMSWMGKINAHQIDTGVGQNRGGGNKHPAAEVQALTV
jgi:hypothetical protein